MSRLDNILAVFRSAEQNAGCCEFDEVPLPPPPAAPGERASKELQQQPVIAEEGKLGTGPRIMCQSSIHHYFELQELFVISSWPSLPSDVQIYFLRGSLMRLSPLSYICAFIETVYLSFI